MIRQPNMTKVVATPIFGWRIEWQVRFPKPNPKKKRLAIHRLRCIDSLIRDPTIKISVISNIATFNAWSL